MQTCWGNMVAKYYIIMLSLLLGCSTQVVGPNFAFSVVDEAGDEEDITSDVSEPFSVVLEDKFTNTRKICDPPMDWYEDPLWYEQISDQCEQQISADIGLTAPVGDYSESSLDSFFEQQLYRGMYYLLALDMPDVQSFEDYPLPSAVQGCLHEDVLGALVQMGEQTDNRTANAVMYNFITSSINEIYLTDKDPSTELNVTARADIENQSVEVYVPRSLFEGTPILSHEAAHIWLPSLHVACPDGHPYEGYSVCDEQWLSAYGFSAAIDALMYVSVEPMLALEDSAYSQAQVEFSYNCQFVSELILR